MRTHGTCKAEQVIKMKLILLAVTAAAAAVVLCRRRRKRRRQRSSKKGRIWVRPHIYARENFGAFYALLPGLKEQEVDMYSNFVRMPREIFDRLLLKVTPLINKECTTYRASISPNERLALTLRFLGTGDSYTSLSYLFRVGRSTIGVIVPEVCEAIYTVLKDEYLKCPGTKREWLAIADGFHQKWQFPHCLGALDGKHVVLKQPFNSGSTYYNYKGTSSIVLMALVDAEYNFLYVDVGCNGRVSDGGVFNGCTLQKALERKSSMFPDPSPCLGDDRPISYFIVADDAFPLKENIMKPFSHKDMLYERRIFNYRLSRARRVVENAFGILANRFRVFLGKISLQPEIAEKIVLACCVMHNMLRQEMTLNAQLTDQEDPVSHVVTPGTWRSDPTLNQAALPSGTNTTSRAKAMREYLVCYVNSDVGRVAWQDDMI